MSRQESSSNGGVRLKVDLMSNLPAGMKHCRESVVGKGFHVSLFVCLFEFHIVATFKVI